MSIDTSGEFWVGAEASDLDEYLRAYTAERYPAETIVHARCTCGHSQFELLVDADEGFAQRTCTRCQSTHPVCDSDEYVEEADPVEVECGCGGTVFDLAVGFSHRDEGSVKWITVGNRCVQCGTLGSAVDWKIDYAPTDHLYARV